MPFERMVLVVVADPQLSVPAASLIGPPLAT